MAIEKRSSLKRWRKIDGTRKESLSKTKRKEQGDFGKIPSTLSDNSN